ncbi:hypothetical protein MTR_7g087020 [Medicago truncatula]|uniref:Uncharacterized protein n=1 Tax=Medicago truncatula TaxID=3880 RepID=G7L2K7_MEDTR|nr:hypothetical protein MTR_7g087020 [Medicago truncatula]
MLIRGGWIPQTHTNGVDPSKLIKNENSTSNTNPSFLPAFDDEGFYGMKVYKA